MCIRDSTLIVLIPLTIILRGRIKIPNFLFFALLANITGQILLLVMETLFHAQYVLSLGDFRWTLIFLLIVLVFAFLLALSHLRAHKIKVKNTTH